MKMAESKPQKSSPSSMRLKSVALGVGTVFFAWMVIGKESQWTKVLHTTQNPEFRRSLPTCKSPEPKPPIHIMFALCGNSPGFFIEFKIALKTLLLNAPHNRPMHVHILADQPAYNNLPEVWNDTKVDGIEWWCNITIIPYSVGPRISGWGEIVKNGTGFPPGNRHTFGTYFRLFANDVLPTNVEYVLYIDTDVVVLANLNHLFQNLEDDLESLKEKPLFVMAAECAGVMLVNVPKLDKFWEHVNSFNWTPKTLKMLDQSMVVEVGKQHPGTVKLLSAPWDLTSLKHWPHLGTVNRSTRKRTENVEKLTKFRPEAGIFHYNGGGSNHDSYFNSEFVTALPHSYGLPAIFFRDLPWTWVRFMGKSVGGPANTGVRIQGTSNATVISRYPIRTIRQS